MASQGMITTLAIIGGGVAIGATAGFATPFVAGGLVAGAGFSTTAALVGGSLAISAGMAVAGATETPEESSTIQRQLTIRNDAEDVHERVYGEVVKGGTLVWAGLAGNQDEKIGSDIVLADHVCQEFIAIEVADDYLPIVTDPDAAEGIILNSDRDPEHADFPSDWYVPVKASRWDREDATKNSSDNVPHIGVKVFLGDQTATDTFMDSAFAGGTENSRIYTPDSITRKFINKTVAHVVIRADPELGTGGGVPRMSFQMKGADDIWDPRGGGSTGYSDNPALIAADYAKKTLGLDPVDADLITAADDCDVEPNSDGRIRFNLNLVVRDDEDPADVLELMAVHMGPAGKIHIRGDEVRVIATGSKSSLATYDLSEISDQRTVPAEQDAWINTITPHRVYLTAEDDDGNTVMHSQMAPQKEQTLAAWRTEDGGEVLRVDRRYRGFIASYQAKYTSRLELEMLRLQQGVTIEARLTRKAMVHEPGDVITIDNPEHAGSAIEVYVDEVGIDPVTLATTIRGRPWSNAILGAGFSEAEDIIGKRAPTWSDNIPTITGLAAVQTVPYVLNADGTIGGSITVTWDTVPSLTVTGGGSVQIWWRLSGQSWSNKRTTTVSGADTVALLRGTFARATYDITVRAIGLSRHDVGGIATPVEVTMVFAFEDLGDVPMTYGGNYWGANWHLEGQVNHASGGEFWDLYDHSQTAAGVATFEATGGRSTGSPHCHQIVLDGTTVTNYVVDSADLTTAAWTIPYGTATRAFDQVGIDGSANSASIIADTDVANATPLRTGPTLGSTGTATLTVMIKADADISRFPMLRLLSYISPSVLVMVDTSNGHTITMAGTATVESSPESRGGATWHRISITFTATSTTGHVEICPAYGTVWGSGAIAPTGSIIVGHAQLDNEDGWTLPIITSGGTASGGSAIDDELGITYRRGIPVTAGDFFSCKAEWWTDSNGADAYILVLYKDAAGGHLDSETIVAASHANAPGWVGLRGALQIPEVTGLATMHIKLVAERAAASGSEVSIFDHYKAQDIVGWATDFSANNYEKTDDGSGSETGGYSRVGVTNGPNAWITSTGKDRFRVTYSFDAAFIRCITASSPHDATDQMKLWIRIVRWDRDADTNTVMGNGALIAARVPDGSGGWNNGDGEPRSNRSWAMVIEDEPPEGIRISYACHIKLDGTDTDDYEGVIQGRAARIDVIDLALTED